MKRWTSGILTLLYYFWAKSLRVRWGGQAPKEPALYLFWHSQFFPLPYVKRGKGIVVLVSRHQDREGLTRLLRTFGFGVARGSTSRGGVQASLFLLEALRRGKSVALTPDGPRGPRRLFKEETVDLLRLAGGPSVLVGVGFGRKKIFSSWDRFELPLPFSRCYIHLLPLPEGKILTAQELQDQLEALTEWAGEVALGRPTHSKFPHDGQNPQDREPFSGRRSFSTRGSEWG